MELAVPEQGCKWCSDEIRWWLDIQLFGN